MKPFFSIILTTYNRAHIIDQVINSISKQKYKNFELLIIDDCSTDDTSTIISNIDDSRIKYFKTRKNSGGPAIPRNIGLLNSKGSWVCFCDSDDLFLPNHLTLAYNFIAKKKLTNSLISSNAFIDKTLTTKYFKGKSVNQHKRISLYSNYLSNKAILSTLFVSNSNVILFNEDTRYVAIEDYMFILSNMKAGKKHYYLSEPTIFYNPSSPDSVRLANDKEWKILISKWKMFTNSTLCTLISMYLLIKLVAKSIYLKLSITNRIIKQ